MHDWRPLRLGRPSQAIAAWRASLLAAIGRLRPPSHRAAVHHAFMAARDGCETVTVSAVLKVTSVFWGVVNVVVFRRDSRPLFVSKCPTMFQLQPPKRRKTTRLRQ